MLPSGRVRKEYVEECSRQKNKWIDDGSLHLISIKALMVLPSLLLQKPSKTSKIKDHVEKLRKRLDLWKSGNVDDLVREAHFIQSRLSKHKLMNSIDKVAKTFNDFVINGKINAALKLLSDMQSSGILQLHDSTLQLLKKKHLDVEEKF